MFELSTKRREDFLWDLSDDRHFIKKYMIEIPKPNSDADQILILLKSYGAPRMCYAISLSPIDGQYLPLDIALETAVGHGMGSLISCIPGKLAYWEGEQCYGPPPRYILYRP